jgi:polar amino acid transport system substrate-binding protein
MNLRIGSGRIARLGIAVAAMALAAAGCGSSSSGGSSSSTAPSSSAASSSQASASKPSLGPLVSAGTLHFCSDISSPPLEFYKNGTQATGSDIDLGTAIAAKLGVHAVWVNTAFSGIVPALQAGHCDAIISQLFDKAARRKVVDFVDYMNSSEAVLVRHGNPMHIGGISGLCGHTVAAETGTTVTDFLTQQSQQCKAKGKAPITVRTFLRDADALEQLGLDHVDAYGTTLETGAYDMSNAAGQFQFAGGAFGQILTGIATRKNDPALHQAIAGAFAALRADGTDKAIMSKWHLSADLLK